ncbi:MAG: diacylglycerol kinase [Flavobacteriales bacterium]|nr:MAG: diacylglycerol kinase [Flavobacteriales bacterium]
MRVSIIAAVAENQVIGKDNGLPWYLPADMRHFQNTTKSHHVIMGRKNYLSIPEKYRPLPERTNIVVTRRKNYVATGCIVVHSIEQGIERAKNNRETETFIIGGGEIYKQALERNLVNKMYITWVHKQFKGNVFFPEFNKNEWKETERTDYEPDEKNKHPFSICIYEK